MLKGWRRVGRAKKIGVLNFFLLLIITIILGYSFLFIHEESFSEKNHLFLSDHFYALRSAPLLIKKSASSEPATLLDFISSGDLREMAKTNFSSLIMEQKSCEDVWWKNFKLVVRFRDCEVTGSIDVTGPFLPWLDVKEKNSKLVVKFAPERPVAAHCPANLALMLTAKETGMNLQNFRSELSLEEALELFSLSLAEVVKVECLP